MKQEEDYKTFIKIKTATPAYIPIICPVCHGHKTVNWGKQVCGVCEGMGYLKIPPEEGEDYGKNY